MIRDVEKVAGGLYLEGLAVDRARGDVWYSDVIGGGIFRVSADGRACSWNRERKWTGGILPNHDGAVLSSGAHGIAWLDPQSGATGWLIRSVEGVPLAGTNEMVADAAGGLYFGTVDIPAIERGETPGPAAICRIAPDGTARRVVENLVFSNGMALSSDGGELYHCESFHGVFAYEVRGDGSLGHARKLLDRADCDGMAMDVEGNLWVSGFRSGEISCLSPDGSLVRTIATAGGAITQLRFGGSDLRDLYFNEVPADAGDRLAEGDLPEDEVSFLWRGRSDVPGRDVLPARLALDKLRTNGPDSSR